MPAIQEIPLAAVDLEDHPFAVASGDVTLVAASLEAVGLLSPPWLRARSDGRWQAVTGCKRLKAAAALGWQAVPAQLLTPDTPDSRCLLISLHDNASNRGFTLWEQIFYASRLSSYWERQTVVQQFLPLLGLPPARKYLDRLLAAAGLEEAWQPLLGQQKLALTAAARLAAWPPADRLAALPFFQVLPFSQSKQEELVEWLELLSRREGVAIADILGRPELASCLADPAQPRQEQAAALRGRLRAWVSPRLSAAREAWEKGLARSGLKHHPRLRLTPPPVFEGSDFHLEIKFRDGAELRQTLKELNRIARQKDFSELTSL